MTDAALEPATARTFFSGRRQRLARRISQAALVAVALVALADFLFYRQQPGINLPIFMLALAAGTMITRGLRVKFWPALTAGALLVALLLPSIEALTPFSLLAALAGITIFSLTLFGRTPKVLTDLPATLVRFGVLAPVRSGIDAFKFLMVWRVDKMGNRIVRTLLVWIVPTVLAAVFLLLFASANPVIEWVLNLINIDYLLSLLNPGRIIFWGFMISFVWPFLLPRLLRWRKAKVAETVAVPAVAESLIFGQASILRSLIVFNAMFAVQTLLDIAYLWGGVALPDGMTYANYAHRGAYPLIVTALLAAAFVLAAMRKGGAAEKSQTIRVLVYLFIAQNVWLVVSSILRLDLYVQTYSLTELRIAAGIWMGLVGVGLLLIMARIALRKSNKWLVSMNLLSLAVTLYGCAYVDFSALISRFNVEHSFELTGEGAPLDFYYLRDLGPGAIPALDAFIASIDREREDYQYAVATRDELVYYFQARVKDWRNWNFRDWRLDQYVADEHPVPISPESIYNRMSAD